MRGKTLAPSRRHPHFLPRRSSLTRAHVVVLLPLRCHPALLHPYISLEELAPPPHSASQSCSVGRQTRGTHVPMADQWRRTTNQPEKRQRQKFFHSISAARRIRSLFYSMEEPHRSEYAGQAMNFDFIFP
nr:uncharacterized protein LOC127318623 isoform X2 [Lolium perenne]